METLLGITMNFHISVTRFTYSQHLAGFAPLLLLSHGQIIVIIACFFIFAELVKSTPWDVFVFVPEDVSTVSSEEGHSPTQPPCHCASVTVHIQISPCVPTMCFMAVLPSNQASTWNHESHLLSRGAFLSQPFSFSSSAFWKSADLDFDELPRYLSLSTRTQLSICIFGNPGFLEMNCPL